MVAKEGQRRLIFLFDCKVSPLTTLMYPPTLIASPSVLALSPHRQLWQIVVFGDSGRPLMASQ